MAFLLVQGGAVIVEQICLYKGAAACFSAPGCLAMGDELRDKIEAGVPDAEPCLLGPSEKMPQSTADIEDRLAISDPDFAQDLVTESLLPIGPASQGGDSGTVGSKALLVPLENKLPFISKGQGGRRGRHNGLPDEEYAGSGGLRGVGLCQAA